MSRMDYERAGALEALTQNKVFRDAVYPQWLNDAEGRFVYRIRTPPGTSSSTAWIVNPSTAEKSSCFASMGVTLPVLSPSPALRSGHSGFETEIIFVNDLDEDLRILWVDWDGVYKEYRVVRSGETCSQHTYVSHAWVVSTFKDRLPICAFVATDIRAKAPIRDARKFPSSTTLSTRKWSAFVQGSTVCLRSTQIPTMEVVLTRDAPNADTYDEAELYWSPDDKKLVAMQTSLSHHKRHIYLVETSPKDQVQPKLHTIKYPKPGDPLPQKYPHLFNVMAQKEIYISKHVFADAYSLSEPRWQSDSSRFFVLYNRRGHQVLCLLAVDASTGHVKVIVEEKSNTFIDYNGKHFIHYLDKTGELIWMSERDGWNHLYLYDSQMGVLKNQVTSGKWVVRGVERVDEKMRQVTFKASGVYPTQDPYYIHYGRANFDGTDLIFLTKADGSHSLQFSPCNRYFIDTYSRVDCPPTIDLCKVTDGSLITELEVADAVALQALDWMMPLRFVAKGRDRCTDIYGIIFRPMNFETQKKYPVVEEIYAGPQGSHVPKAFKAYHGTAQRLAELGFIVVIIDGMGTSNRSKAFHDVCYKNLGDAGLPDRILWIQAAARKYTFMDISRVGIYGVSAGGQNALRALLMYPEFYKVGVSASGCHDNRMDKLWWNELWMGWPVGPHYETQSNVTHAHLLQGKLLLIVCEMDDNVDPASTFQVVNALIKADKDFELVVIPGEKHGLGGVYGERKMQDFFVRHLLQVEPRHT